MNEVDVEVSASKPPRLSVVIPTFNRLASLQRVVESLARQDVGEPFEVIVVSDGSSDGTNEYLSGETPVPLVGICQPNRGPAAARNAGIARALGRVVLFLDDDVVADASLIRTHLEEHLHLGDDAVVIGPMLNPSDHVFKPWVAWEQAMLAKQYHAMNEGYFSATARQFYTGNASISRAHLDAVQGFDETLLRAEDVELAFRLADRGLTFHFAGDAIGYHYADRSFESWRTTAYAYGRNDIVFARDHRREWIFGFIADGHQGRSAPMRALVKMSLFSTTLRRIVERMLELPVRLAGARLPTSLVRGALSGIYAIEYHRGLSDEMGTIGYRDLIEHRTAGGNA